MAYGGLVSLYVLILSWHGVYSTLVHDEWLRPSYSEDPVTFISSQQGEVDDIREYLQNIPRTVMTQVSARVSRILTSTAVVSVEQDLGEACQEVDEEPWNSQDMLLELINTVKDDTESCPDCMNIMGVLQKIACRFRYKPLRAALILVCEILYSRDETKNPAMCNGTVYLQFPAVYTILREVTPYVFCETLNYCYPPPDELTSRVSQRVQRLLNSRSSSMEARKVMTSQAQQIKVAHLTDAHIHTLYATGSALDCGMYMCCLDEFSGKGSARMYGEYECNIPERTFHHLLEHLAQAKPDLILYTGDSSPHTIWTESINSKLNCTSLVINALKDIVPDVRTYPTLGNHEMFPTNIYSMDYSGSKAINHGYAALWGELAGFGDEQQQTMKDLAYYSMTDPVYTKLRILSINTNHYWSTRNFVAALNSNSTAEADHRQYIDDTLSHARDNNEKVIILGHHPVSSSGSIIRATRRWQQVLLTYSDVIIMYLSGHTHKDEFHLFLDPDTDEAKAINYVAPSATSNHFVNPSFRIYHLDQDNLELTDFENYFMELDAQKPNEPPPVVKGYSAKQLYALPDLSPKSWKELSIRFVDDDSKFDAWFRNKDAQATDGLCDDACRQQHICSMWFVNYDEVDACMAVPWVIDATWRPSGDIHILIILGFVYVLLIDL